LKSETKFCPLLRFCCESNIIDSEHTGAVFELSISPAVTLTGLRNLRRQIYSKKLHVIRESYLYAQDGKFRNLAWFPAILIEGFIVISPYFSTFSEKC